MALQSVDQVSVRKAAAKLYGLFGATDAKAFRKELKLMFKMEQQERWDHLANQFNLEDGAALSEALHQVHVGSVKLHDLGAILEVLGLLGQGLDGLQKKAPQKAETLMSLVIEVLGLLRPDINWSGFFANSPYRATSKGFWKDLRGQIQNLSQDKAA